MQYSSGTPSPEKSKQTMWPFQSRRSKPRTEELSMPKQDQLIPVQGYMLLKFSFIERKPSVDFIRDTVLATAAPILAFQVVEGLPLAIPLGGNRPADVEVIRAPSGVFYDASGKVWPHGIDSWVQDCYVAWLAWTAARAKTPAPVAPIKSGDIVAGGRASGFLSKEAAALVG
jgi:hypothetical protein